MKSKQDKTIIKFLGLCQQQLDSEPNPQLLSMLDRTSLILEPSHISQSNIPHIQILLSLGLTSITVKGNSQPILKKLLDLIIKSLRYSESIMLLHIQNCSALNQLGDELCFSLSRNRSLRELILKNCYLEDNFFIQVMPSLKSSSNINAVNISYNHFVHIGQQVYYILDQHNRFRNQKLHMCNLRGQIYDDLAKEGILQLNLEGNKIDNTNSSIIARCLREDKWMKCINLNNNLIGVAAVQDFIVAIQQNKSILSLDLRNNPGFSIESSNLIFKKLVSNVNHYKNTKNKQRREVKNGNSSADNGYPRGSDKNCTPNHIHEQSVLCDQCRKSSIKILQIEKRAMDLHIQNKRLKKLLQNRGFEISMINPSSHTQEISFNGKNIMVNDNSDDLAQKIETMMAQLTKILEAAQVQHHTQIDITNPLSNTHNMSNTVQILANNHHSLTVPLPQEEDELSQIQ